MKAFDDMNLRDEENSHSSCSIPTAIATIPIPFYDVHLAFIEPDKRKCPDSV